MLVRVDQARGERPAASTHRGVNSPLQNVRAGMMHERKMSIVVEMD